MMFCLTDRAQQTLRRFLEDQENPDLFFRLRAEGSGCSGYRYSLSIDDLGRKSDRIQHFDEIQVRTDEHSALLLQGAMIDYRSDHSGLHVVSARSLTGCSSGGDSCGTGCGQGGCGAGGCGA